MASLVGYLSEASDPHTVVAVEDQMGLHKLMEVFVCNLAPTGYLFLEVVGVLGVGSSSSMEVAERTECENIPGLSDGQEQEVHEWFEFRLHSVVLVVVGRVLVARLCSLSYCFGFGLIPKTTVMNCDCYNGSGAFVKQHGFTVLWICWKVRRTQHNC